MSRNIEFDEHGFIIRGQREFLIGGEFHYFRTPPELWEDRLLKMARCRANLVTTYIPWNWHEPREGQERWTGEADLDRFLRLCQKYNLFVIVKPGPYCCAEWDFGGHPDWLLSKNIPLRVLNDRYLEYVRKWYARVAEIIGPHLVTRGGPIVCIQVENEYDHLMEYGEEKITREQAIEYFTRLAHLMDEFGIDIPKFANEAAFLRGHPQFIDTRTYYPNIPLFQFWMYMHRYFDGKIRDAKKGQPHCPTMILELQVGWFAQFGRPLYLAPLHLTESVSKSVVALGASVLNYYMYVGGTTFPFWTCRGNIWEILPRGFGTCTTFDFGGSPIREWGELMPGRMDYIRALSTCVRDFKDLLLEGEDSNELKVLAGGENILRITPQGVAPDRSLNSESENFDVFAHRSGDQYLVCIRNLSPEAKRVDVGFAESGEVVFKDLLLAPRQTFLLPVNVRVPGSNLVIRASTSELLFARKINGSVWVGLFGKKGSPGETVLSADASPVPLLGQLTVEGAKLRYVHDGVAVCGVGNDRLVILDQDIAGKIEFLPKGLLVTDAYFVREIEESESEVRLLTQLRNGSRNQFTYLGANTLQSATVGKKSLPISSESSAHSFIVRVPKQKPVKFEWLSPWRYAPDTQEASPEFDDSDWMVLPEPVSLEIAGLLDHGYIWYRTAFELPADVAHAELVYPGNDCDRQRIYINGTHAWEGITQEQRISLSGLVRPGTNYLAVLYENFFHSKSHPHEGAIRKYSGIMKPVVVQGTLISGEPFRQELRAFRVRMHTGAELQGAISPEFDDSGWTELMPSHRYVFARELGQIFWLRRRFAYRCSRGWEVGVRLTIPQADQRCFLYINGRPLGQFESAGPQHDFYVPEPFLRRENVLVICLEGNGAVLTEPELGTFYEVKTVPITLRFS